MRSSLRSHPWFTTIIILTMICFLTARPFGKNENFYHMFQNSPSGQFKQKRIRIESSQRRGNFEKCLELILIQPTPVPTPDFSWAHNDAIKCHLCWSIGFQLDPPARGSIFGAMTVRRDGRSTEILINENGARKIGRQFTELIFEAFLDSLLLNARFSGAAHQLATASHQFLVNENRP